jgi:hypothetical protein
VHAVWAQKAAEYRAIIINSNPETISTDFDTSDRLYFEPLVLEDVLKRDRKKRGGRHRAVRRPDGDQPGRPAVGGRRSKGSGDGGWRISTAPRTGTVV